MAKCKLGSIGSISDVCHESKSKPGLLTTMVLLHEYFITSVIINIHSSLWWTGWSMIEGYTSCSNYDDSLHTASKVCLRYTTMKNINGYFQVPLSIQWLWIHLSFYLTKNSTWILENARHCGASLTEYTHSTWSSYMQLTVIRMWVNLRLQKIT